MTDRRAESVHRLQSVEREITEMARLIEQGQDCLAVVRRGLAAKQALGAIGLALIESHLRDEVRAVLTCDDPDCRARRVARLAEAYEALNRFLCPACRSEWRRSPLSKPLESKEETDV